MANESSAASERQLNDSLHVSNGIHDQTNGTDDEESNLAARLEGNGEEECMSVPASPAHWENMEANFQQAIATSDRWMADLTHPLPQGINDLFAVNCKSTHCPLCLLKKSFWEDLKVAETTQDLSRQISHWASAPTDFASVSHLDAYSEAVESLGIIFAQLRIDRDGVVADQQFNIETLEALEAATSKIREAKQAAAVADRASKQAVKGSFRAKRATDNEEVAKVDETVTGQSSAMLARIRALEAELLAEKATSDAKLLAEKATSDAKLLAQKATSEARLLLNHSVLNISKYVAKAVTSYNEVDQILYSLGSLGKETVRFSERGSSAVDISRIGTEDVYSHNKAMEVIETAGKLDLDNWDSDLASEERKITQLMDLPVKENLMERRDFVDCDGGEERAFMRTQRNKYLVNDLENLYDFLDKGFGKAEVGTTDEQFQETAKLIYDWRVRNPTSKKTFYVPDNGKELQGWQPILNAIMFEVCLIVKGNPNFTIEQTISGSKKFPNRRVDASVSCVGEHVLAMLPFMNYCVVELKPIRRSDEGLRRLHEEGANQVIGHLAKKIHHFFHFGGIGVDRKCRGAVLTAASIEIIEMELSHMGTAEVRVELRRSGICWLFKPKAGRKLLSLNNYVKFPEGIVKADGFYFLAKLLQGASQEDDIFTSKGKIYINLPAGKSEIRQDSLLGMGTFGCVYNLGHSKIAKLPKSYRAVASLKREREVLRLFDHECIPKCLCEAPVSFEVRCDKSFLCCLVIKGIVGNPASTVCSKVATTPPSKVLQAAALEVIYKDIRAALEHAHSKGVIHMDVRPQNIIWGVKQHRAQLIDWGCASYVVRDLKNFRGSVPFAHDQLLEKKDKLLQQKDDKKSNKENADYKPNENDLLLGTDNTDSCKANKKPVAAYDFASLTYTMAAILSENDGQPPWWGFYKRNLLKDFLTRRNELAVKLIGESGLSDDTKAQLKVAIATESTKKAEVKPNGNVV